MEVLRIDNLYKSYKNKPALSGVSVTIPEGRIVGLLGPNGSGKTTLLKCVAGLLTPDSGIITVDGKLVGAESKAVTAFLPDKNFLCEWMTVEKMVTYTKDFFADFDEARAINLINDLGISLKDNISALSKGTKEKLALILTMSRRAKLYLLDEPIAGVDPAARDYVIKTILSNYAPTSSVLISTHLIYDIEGVLDDAMFLCGGKITFAASCEYIHYKLNKSVDELFREMFRC